MTTLKDCDRIVTLAALGTFGKAGVATGRRIIRTGGRGWKGDERENEAEVKLHSDCDRKHFSGLCRPTTQVEKRVDKRDILVRHENLVHAFAHHHLVVHR